MVEGLAKDKDEIVNQMLEKYTAQGITVFAGSILRLFTKSGTLVSALANMERLKKLASLICNPAFEISSDAFSTFQVSC